MAERRWWILTSSPTMGHVKSNEAKVWQNGQETWKMNPHFDAPASFFLMEATKAQTKLILGVLHYFLRWPLYYLHETLYFDTGCLKVWDSLLWHGLSQSFCAFMLFEPLFSLFVTSPFLLHVFSFPFSPPVSPFPSFSPFFPPLSLSC